MGVTDGDTISVMRDGRAVRVRLEGIDCPENGQDFSQSAKRFTSDMAFGKEATIEVRDVDRYGRLVARVQVGGEDVSLALVQAGLAWHYLQILSRSDIGEGGNDGEVSKAWTLEPPEPGPALGVSTARLAFGPGRP